MDGSGASVEWVRIDNTGLKIRGNLAYHAGNKPTATDVGLGSVNNWGATSAVNDASNTKYATAGAVKTAYDLAAAAMPKTGGIFSGGIVANGSIFSDTGVIRSKVAGTTSGGIHIGGGDGYAEIAPLLNADTIPVWAQALRYYGPDDWRIGATSRIFHANYLPTAAQVGALPSNGGILSGALTVALGASASGVKVETPSYPGFELRATGNADNVRRTIFEMNPSGALNIITRSDAGVNNGVVTINPGASGTVFHTGNAPTAAQVGLGSVQNWTYSNSYTGGSASKYATEKAVTDAYNALNTSKASKGGDTFTAQMIFSNGTNTIGGGGDLTKAWALFGTAANGLGIDTNEIHQSGDNLYLSADAARDIQLRIGGTTRARVNSTGLVTDALTLIGGPTMAYNSTTGCLEITFA
jgi:hypothetical protein